MDHALSAFGRLMRDVVDTTTELELTTITELPLTKVPNTLDNKETGINLTETTPVPTNVDTEHPPTPTNTTATPSETETQDPLTDIPEISVNIRPEFPQTDMDINTQSTTTNTSQTETLSTDTTEMLYFKLNQLLKNKTKGTLVTERGPASR